MMDATVIDGSSTKIKTADIERIMCATVVTFKKKHTVGGSKISFGRYARAGDRNKFAKHYNVPKAASIFIQLQMFAKVNLVGNLKGKKTNILQVSLLTKKVSIRLFLFLMKVAAKFHVDFTNDEFYKNVSHVYVSQRVSFSGPRKRLSHKII